MIMNNICRQFFSHFSRPVVLRQAYCVAPRFSSFQPKFSQSLYYINLRAAHIYGLHSMEDYQNYLAERSGRFALLDFYADWDGTSLLQKDRLATKVETRDEEFDLLQVDVGTAVDVAEYFQVAEVPTLISHDEEGEIDRIVGDVDDETLDEILEDLIDRSQHHG
ncbi:unnamed protein product [Bursaphelenchus xylophilus]|uniref:(pine wood nematode) hypothetical protein n=1 Tax=Bursaphelenchus xylophilus TaxID=6326 RepID=A0A1I7SQI0_BURXY|nr:unnamed protein product [Bursaphelenchus xylophilus]CAG9109922.1 unnamed protein product [Bursaphelenchus xylophilus]